MVARSSVGPAWMMCMVVIGRLVAVGSEILLIHCPSVTIHESMSMRTSS